MKEKKGMVSVDTGKLRVTADQMEKDAMRYNSRIAKLENCIFEIRNQEFDRKEEILRALKIQKDELYQQRYKFLELSEMMRSICRQYDTTEQKIQEHKPYGQKTGQINMVNLKQVQEYLQAMGMKIEEL